MSKLPGRPTHNAEGKKVPLNTRVSPKCTDKLTEVVKLTGLSKAELIEKALWSEFDRINSIGEWPDGKQRQG